MSFLSDLLAIFTGRRGKTPATTQQDTGLRAFARGLAFDQRPQLEDLPEATHAQSIVKQICGEAKAAAATGAWQYNLTDAERWKSLKGDPADVQIAVMLAAMDRRPNGSAIYAGSSYQIQALRTGMVSQILRRNLPFTEAQLVELLNAWLAQKQLDWGIPGKALLGAFERLSANAPLSSATKKLLAQVRDRALGKGIYGQGPNKTLQEIGDRAARLLDPKSIPAPALPKGAFSIEVAAWSQIQGATGAWRQLFTLAAEAGDKTKPSGKWIASMKAALSELNSAAVSQRVIQWMTETVPDPVHPDLSLDILKGLIWASVCLDHATFAGPLGRFAETCYRKVPNYGARSVKLGNAALWALSEMAGEPRAAAELIRLREKIKYPSARALIDNRLGELAKKSGQTVQGLEDVSLPDFGLGADGRLVQAFGDARAELRLSATEVMTQWFSASGQPIKSIPTEVKRDHGAALAVFRNLAKDIEGARASQVTRLEQSWVENRDWTFDDWQTHFLGHPLRRPVTEALVWRIEDGESVRVIMPREGVLSDIAGQPIAVSAHARVRLWHPLDSAPAEVLAWRRRIVDGGFTQPIKQAHREIYVLTDAERRTETYSNRFAAHILRQHQFRALCQARGWTYGLMGNWDSWNVPERKLPAFGLHVQYQVELVDDGHATDAEIPLHLASDQVRFLDTRNEPLALEAVPPIVFSEVLRDVDLFVAVTSVANDPNWTDGGPNGHHGGYWTQWAFGDLGQSAQTRRELIAALAPRLSIREKLEVTDKFLIVQGKRQKYAIHFGSSNIQILPSNRYLCIVPDKPPAEAVGLKLPFAGDGLLSIILSKAFMLVDESRIKDETILRQL